MGSIKIKMNTFTLIRREIKLSVRNFGLILSYSSFFLLSLLIFTFGVGPDLKQLNTVYIPIIWVIMLFAIILVSDNFLLTDFQSKVIHSWTTSWLFVVHTYFWMDWKNHLMNEELVFSFVFDSSIDLTNPWKNSQNSK